MTKGGLLLVRVPMCKYLLRSDTEASELAGQENTLGGPEIGRGVEPASDGLPGELPAADEGAGKALLQVSLDVESAQPGSAGPIPDDGEIVTDDAGGTLGRGEAGKQGKSGPAAHGLRDLCVVDTRQGHADVC